MPFASLHRPSVADVQSAERDTIAWVPRDLLIGGAFVKAAADRTLGVEDPATGGTLAQIADASPADCMAALEAAVAAQDPPL